MRRWLFLFLLFPSLALAQVPQTPRQALLEMIRAASPDQIDKHTTDVLLQEMAKLPPDVRQRHRQSMMFLSTLMALSPNAVKTYVSGPIFAVVQNPKDNSRVEITVERDDMTGNTDVMEFGIHVAKEGKDEALPVEPRIMVEMKLEQNVWKLSRIGGSAMLQLDDPKVAALIVKGMQDQAKKQAGMTVFPPSARVAPRTTAESNVVSSLRSLNTAEVTYASTFPRIGYTCEISDLGGRSSGEPASEHNAQIITPALQTGTRYGYKIEFAGCAASPSEVYRIIAIPTQKGLGHPVYCTDQSAVVRSIDQETADQCLTRGKPVE
jgi:hypothetical protein